MEKVFVKIEKNATNVYPLGLQHQQIFIIFFIKITSTRILKLRCTDNFAI